MAGLYVEEWSPEYGTSVQPDDALAPSEGEIDPTVEVMGGWAPIGGRDDECPAVAFVDGIRRVDARLTIDEPEGPVPGLCGSFAVGSVVWRRDPPASTVEEVRVERLAVFVHGRSAAIPAGRHGLVYQSESVAGSDPGLLISHFHTQMRRAEAVLALQLARSGYFVVADGPISELAAEPVVGYIKSHRVSYLPPALTPIIGELQAGQRTPLFGMPSYARYSWYLRLAPRTGHSWSGVVRCEAPGSLSLVDAQLLADRTAALLPRFASEAHIDPRAPQNLVPIGALERELRRRLGDRDFVYRALRESIGQGLPV
jgi:hypothetical protein